MEFLSTRDKTHKEGGEGRAVIYHSIGKHEGLKFEVTCMGLTNHNL